MNIIEVKDLSVYFPLTKRLFKPAEYVKAVDGISFDIKKNTIYGLAGESGSGKTTAGKAIINLIPLSGGKVIFNEKEIDKESANSKTFRKDMQIIFQDPIGSLNPHKRIRSILEGPLNLHKLYQDPVERKLRIESVLKSVCMETDILDRYPHKFSGGQLQRICIARAILLEPKLLVCDESIASLDVSIQAQIINMLKDVQEKYNLTILFISHNISVLQYLCDDLGVMYLGHLVESASAEELFDNPLHPYTKALLSVVPTPDPHFESTREKTILEGEIPSPINPPIGCPFNTRCPVVIDICKEMKPTYKEVKKGHFVACHLVAGEI